MAIQLPNPGLGDGQTGDNEFVMWTKVKDNFSNTTHAASRFVGKNNGDLLEAGTGGIGRMTTYPISKDQRTENGFFSYLDGNNSNDTSGAPDYQMIVSANWGNQYEGAQILIGLGTLPTLGIRSLDKQTQKYVNYRKIYYEGNTTKDTATGFLKASSPVLHVYNDSITKIHEAEQLDITVDKKGVGHYEIHGTTGLRKNDGWFMSPPRDVHGNVLCMVDLNEKDGVVILKTYKKKFDFETVSIVHDYDNPMDIPEGVCVEFRFNDLPQEQLDEPIE